MNDIVVSNLTKTFDHKQVLKDFSYCFQAGKTTLIMGKSGCGKTTLLQILIGLEKADSGKITGLDEKRISVVFQENRLCNSFNVLQNLMLVCNGEKKRSEAIELLDRLDLKGCELRKVSELSGGMMRRVAIARALLIPYDILILDEAWKGLDKETKEKTIKTVMNYSKGKTIISVTHDKKEREIMDGIVLKM